MELKIWGDSNSDKCNTLEAISVMGEGKLYPLLQIGSWDMICTRVYQADKQLCQIFWIPVQCFTFTSIC